MSYLKDNLRHVIWNTPLTMVDIAKLTNLDKTTIWFHVNTNNDLTFHNLKKHEERQKNTDKYMRFFKKYFGINPHTERLTFEKRDTL